VIIVLISQSQMMSAGGWGASNITERWRLDSGTPMLIGFTDKWFARNTGEGGSSDQNLVTGKRVLRMYDEFEESAPKKDKTLNESPRKMLLSDFVLEDETSAIDQLHYDELRKPAKLKKN